tara:strand:+ start:2189 stop:3070 length:882 start_codon:yes stop_codon:yes gene_type:complete
MKKKITIDSSLPLLRNGKPHVSYSEVSTWAGCGYRHNLLYIPASDEEIISPYLDYGTIVHDAGESFLNTRKIDIPAVHEKIKEAWKKRGFDDEKWVKEQTARARAQGWKYKHVKLPGWLDSATNALTQLPDFMEEAFPGWKTVEAEHMLYTDVIKTTGYFKGYIDCVIELPNGKHVIIDWKTAGRYGWQRRKKEDFLTLAQVILYKHFWMRHTGKKSRDVKTAYVLLHREAKPGKSVSMVTVSSGPKVMAKAEKMVVNMLKNMASKFTLKNRYSCKFCEFANTERCKGYVQLF